MKELDAIIEEQALLLKWNGYHENGLQNGEPDGAYKEYLKTEINNLLDKDMTLLDTEPVTFHTFGFFNQKKDIVLFTFRYQYDAFLSQLSLKEVEALFNGIPLSVPIEQGSDVWNAKELYQRVKLLSDTIRSTVREDTENRMRDMIEAELSLLKECGYNDASLTRKFYAEIGKSGKDTGKKHDFIVKGKLQTDIPAETMHYRLHYYYHPSSEDLHIKSVHAEIDSISKTFIGTPRYPIPPANDIHKYLLEEVKKRPAVKILAQLQRENSQTKNHKRKL
ncbi:hypothetical protein [Chitinophaga cymbidii]|uniref:Uncharacterized protein n=1 Tax=Chitinophaga cymbidii TaxID=1096750 RepID=A0A512RFL1_9BACT|nr:hypothetical protein [Chitinophaga cymbidii]GEP94499.1 hypothetical protein CCY01nite_07590 [Chitinophaga cymbidii]